VTKIDADDIASTLEDWSLTLTDPGAAPPRGLPKRWQSVAASTDPAVRVESAYALWNPDFLALVPQFADALRRRFLDVRIGLTEDGLTMVYVARADSGGYVTWVGYDPATFGETPQFWDCFPGPLQTFLREVHAGFTSGSPLSYGPSRPRDMATLAERAGFPDGIPGWNDEADIDSTRLLQIAKDGGLLRFCVSPDVGPGEIALVYQGDIDPVELGPEFDKLMMSRLDS
jgi:hypothetical protein